VDSDWDRLISRCQQALGDLVEGRPGPFKALWSHADDVVIMGAFGGYERGWEQVSARLDWAAAGIKATDRAAENVVTVVGDDLAYTVDLEHMTRHAGDQPQPRTLRCTQAYRAPACSVNVRFCPNRGRIGGGFRQGWCGRAGLRGCAGSRRP
jgi:hypothetical protein